MEAEIQVVDVDYQIEQDNPKIRVFGRKENGENILGIERETRPYFYAVPNEDIDDLKQKIEESTFSEKNEQLPVKRIEKISKIDGNKEIQILKIYTSLPPKIPKLRKQISQLEEVEQTREFDIPFYKRYLIDNQISPMEWIKIEGEALDSEEFDKKLELTDIDTEIDIENKEDYETLAFDLEVYKDKIIMASFYSDNYRKLLTTADIEREFSEKVEDEAALIQRINKIIEKRDVEVLTGYNTDEYDFKKLRERAEKHNLELSMGRAGERMKFDRRGRFSSARLKGRMHLDLYPFISHILAPGLDSETLDLDSVAEELLGKKKDEISWEEMKEYWSNGKNLEEFADYALKDSQLAYELSEELIPQIMELSRLTGLIPFDTCRLTYGQLTENYLLKEAFKRNIMAPNRPFNKEREKRRRQGAYSGGFVYSPEPGLYDDIALLDFKSLYPTVMVAHNISPDTLNLEDCDDRFDVEKFDYDFCQDEQGFFPELIERLVKDRSKIKQKMQDTDKSSVDYKSFDSRQKAEKILANSFYGYLGYEGARWYSREAAEATTFMGRKYIKEAVKEAEEQGFEVVYGDTDSLFIRKDNLDQEVENLLEKINSQLPEFMELEYEGYFVRGFFTSTDSGEGAKKKYALLDEEDSMKITGFEQVRRDWSPIAKETQKKVLRKVLNEEIDEAAETVMETIQKLKDGEIPVEKLRIYTTLTKEPEEYDSTAPHVEAAKKAEKHGDQVKVGETVGYVITRGGGNISSRAEIVKHAESYDPEYYIKNQIIPAALRALKVFDYTEEQLKGKGRQSGLGRFG